jgi:hypothetical protein
LQEISLHDTLLPSLPIQRPGLVTRWNKAQQRPNTIAGVFFRLQSCVMAAVRGTSSGVPVSLIPRFTNLRTAATHSLGIGCGSFSNQGSELCAALIRTNFGFPSPRFHIA